jgi:hypothetical protein
VNRNMTKPNMRNQRKSKSSGGNDALGYDKSTPFTGDIVSIKPCDVYSASVRIPRIPKNYFFTLRDNNSYTITGSAVANTGGGSYYSLAQCQNATTLASLFDQYRIVAIDVVLRPRSNAVDVAAASSPPPLYVAIDYDSAATPASANAVLAFSTCAQLASYESMRRVFQPRLAVAAYQGTFAGYSNTTSWIDCAYNTVQHYGLIYFIGICPATVTAIWDIEVKYVLEFRNTL